MPYKVKADATIPRTLVRGKLGDGTEIHETEGVTYGAGDVVYEDDIDGDIIDRLDDGDDHLSSLLEHVSNSEAEKILAEQGRQGPVTAEHAQEAEALASSGKEVLTPDEKIELAAEAEEARRTPVEDDEPEASPADEPEDIRHTEGDERRRNANKDDDDSKSGSKKSGNGRRRRTRASKSKDDEGEE